METIDQELQELFEEQAKHPRTLARQAVIEHEYKRRQPKTIGKVIPKLTEIMIDARVLKNEAIREKYRVDETPVDFRFSDSRNAQMHRLLNSPQIGFWSRIARRLGIVLGE